jgi:protein-tyrosine phosphatase
MTKVLFVCLGNICRSPTAEGVFTRLVKQTGLSNQIGIDSAGTSDYHIGEPADLRSQKAALKRGIDLSGLRARRVTQADFIEFDYVLAMDNANYKTLKKLCPPGLEHKLHLFLDFAPELNRRDVPDPYYDGGQDGFNYVLDLVETASKGLLADIHTVNESGR